MKNPTKNSNHTPHAMIIGFLASNKLSPPHKDINLNFYRLLADNSHVPEGNFFVDIKRNATMFTVLRCSTADHNCLHLMDIQVTALTQYVYNMVDVCVASNSKMHTITNILATNRTNYIKAMTGFHFCCL